MSLTPKEVFHVMKGGLPFAPTAGQEGFLYKLSEFLSEDGHGKVFLLRGFAGTGKTSMVHSIIKAVKAMNRKFALLAPTGRAAKVMAGYAGMRAFTVHKFIYQIAPDPMGRTVWRLRHNTGRRAVIIVDEASMLSSSSEGRGEGVLQDLMRFLESGEQCQLILIGDTAQLPPVGMADSPALSPRFLRSCCDFQPDMHHVLTEVMRQESDSGILTNATALRQLLRDGSADFVLDVSFPDVRSVSTEDLEDALNSAYAEFGEDGVMVVTRSNRRANLFNRQIRSRIRYLEDEIATGDVLMNVRNNYAWLPQKSSAGFIANGDLLRVERLRNTEEWQGFRFADATVRMLDYPDDPALEVRLLLNVLDAEAPSLPEEDMARLRKAVEADHAHLGTPTDISAATMADPRLNALQVKFGYAVTCHKAQGGQWPAVFIDQGYLTEEMMGKEHIRWLYTAVTRASQRLYLVNFDGRFLKGD